MPEKLKKDLQAQAKKKGLTGKRANAYVYSVLRRAGWEPKKKG